jgi:F-type H+-transporting ATPase subunit b
MTHLFIDPSFWVFVALVLFFGLLYRVKVQDAVAKALDARADGIRAKLDAAETLRREAEQLAASYRAKRQAAEGEARAIIASAKAEAERMAVEGKAALEETIKRRTEMAVAKIAQAEAQALADVRATVADVAIAAAGTLIAQQMNDQQSGALVDAGIQAVGARLN